MPQWNEIITLCKNLDQALEDDPNIKSVVLINKNNKITDIPNISKKLDLKTEAIIIFEIYLNRIKETKKKLKDQKSQYKYSDYQKSERDFAFIINEDFKAGDIKKLISNVDTNLIKTLFLK